MSETIQAKELKLVDIFSDNYRFEIPDYQRSYAWTTEQTSDLLDDLLHAMGDVESVSDASPYFLGSIVIIKNDSDPRAQIVDGQQRITTLTILFCVLRELASENNKRTIHGYIYAPDDMFAGIKGHHRLTIRKLDKDFFERNIQHMGKLSDFIARPHASRSDSHQRMLENASYLHSLLAEIDEKRRNTLMQFLLQRCYLVIVSTSDQNSAYRIFSVLNNRGLDLSPIDILKADIIGSLEENVQSRYTTIWERIEEDLGSERFRHLFEHIRMIAMKNRPRGTLQQEFQDHVLNSVDRGDFIDNVLEPYAEAYEVVTGASYECIGDSGKVNEYLRYLNWLDNSNWIPPAIAFYKCSHSNPDMFLRFVRDLERLAYKMFIVRANKNQRINRYRDILHTIELRADLFSPSSPLQLTPRDKTDLLKALNGPVYSQTRMRRTLLLRLDSLLADAGARYDYPTITIEHVLPQNPRGNSQWLTDFPNEEERMEWTHRLANLVLLSRKKNWQALNYDFDRKKKEYFQRGGVAPFALTARVLDEEEWTPAVLQRRQRELINVLKKEWRLEQASPSPPVHVLQEQSKPTYNVEKVQGESLRAYDQTKQPLQKNLTVREEFDATVITQDILQAVMQTEERFGIRHVADVLRGSKNKKVKKWKHDSLPAYGTVNGYSADEITEIADQLIEEGMLYREEGRYPTLSVTQAGKDFLKHGEALTLTRPKREQGKASASEWAALDFDQGLFEKLRDLRSRLAAERGIPLYMIFSNATLQQMAYYFPQSRESFSCISGVGKEKLEQLGEVFVAEIGSYARQHDLLERDIPIAGRRRREVRKDSTYEETRQLWEEGLSVEQIAKERSLEKSTIAFHLERLIEEGMDIDLRPMLPPMEKVEEIKRAVEEIGGNLLPPVKELLGDEYSYYEIKIVWVFLRQQGELPD